MTEGDNELQVSAAQDFAEWDRFVHAAPDGTFCHLAGWRRVMTDILGHACTYLVARDRSSAIRGALPLVSVRSPLGHYLVSVPFLNDGGPIGSRNARHRLVEAAVEHAKTSGAGLLELRSRHGIQSGAVTASFRKIGVHLALPETVEALWSQTFKAKLRSQIRRPAKEGMTAEVGHDQLDAFYDVLARNMRDLGTPVLPRAFFRTLASAFGDQVMMTTVRTPDGKPVAASCCLIWRDEMEVTWASSLREFNPQSPNMLLYATMMEQAVTRGVRVFNFGRSSPGAPTHRFKQQWGGHDVPLPWAFWSRGADAGTPSADSPAFKLAVAVWQRLPLAVANRLGPLLARGLP